MKTPINAFGWGWLKWMGIEQIGVAPQISQRAQMKAGEEKRHQTDWGRVVWYLRLSAKFAVNALVAHS
jgi:hypothetical protein